LAVYFPARASISLASIGAMASTMIAMPSAVG